MIEVRDLSFSYRDYRRGGFPDQLLSGVDILIPAGKRVLVLGPPDSGKSTLSRLLCSLVPRHAEGTLSGKITIGGKDVRSVAPWELTDVVTMVSQNPQEQLLMTTCADEVAFPLEALGIDHDKMVERVHRALAAWGLDELAQVNPQELSGGERKRLLLAVTEAIDAPVWVMDEPFDDLDEQWRTVLMRRLHEHRRTVLIFASRYLDEFRGSFDAYGYVGEKRITWRPEEDVVVSFERECDALFTPKEHQAGPFGSSRLTCDGARIVHPRRSTLAAPFALAVDEFHVDTSEVVALVGPNGCGKSTLSRVLCGLDPVLEGSISIDGRTMASRQLQTRVGYLFQNPDFGIFLPTVRDELSWSLRHDRTVDHETRERLATECARLFHLDLDDNPTMMSYGARKHLQAAVSYMLDRRFVILDELDSGVTYAGAFEIVMLLRARGAGVVVITHDRSFARNLAERQYRIIDGKVIETEVGE